MTTPSLARIRTSAATVAAATVILVLTACTSTPPDAPRSAASGAASGLPDAHVHGLSVDGDTGQVLLATHDGLFDVSSIPAAKIGPSHDLMGYTKASDPGVFYASGHPQAGSDLPSPLGLIKTTDGGRTWQQLSRQNESDFHALAATKSGIVAYDGTLRTSTDGIAWRTVGADFSPFALAGNPNSDTVLATTEEGIQRSTDGGSTWTAGTTAPVIQFAAFANTGEAVGVAPGGTVYYSPDEGVSWQQRGTPTGQVHAVAAAAAADGTLQVWAATSAGLVRSTDGGTTFRPAHAG
ncbi:F510_1955 family glycosylhydrolase [Pseudarthrobacter sp. PH31-O2]|uniref:F510_1955 family glycosylhydrolase n=1 Tax=Pseudarthrobacter sp. PH31-O2 TaxID=3046206 RepID=UPI0024B9336B|nr:exo-alpha-sialidase [Pseudarthrobacter sp. PH31-O2]MDJ0353150.1 exo-alpha-sialidase [Pseudarthrobacter sp. PH31-O2]